MSTPTKSPDEFDAIRVIYEALKPFPKEDQQRLLRWAQEKLDLAVGPSTSQVPQSPSAQPALARPVHHGHGATDIKSFMDSKSPKSDNQFAATVAYFYRFEAPDPSKKDAITKEDLVTACRLVHRKRPKTPAQVLVNAHHQGLLDKGDEAGQYRINSVGENLVAMVLPNDGSGPKRMGKKKTRKKAVAKAKRSTK